MINSAATFYPTAYRPAVQPVSSGFVSPPKLQTQYPFLGPTPTPVVSYTGAPSSQTAPVGSTQNPIRNNPAPTGASAGISSPFPYNNPAGFEGRAGGPTQGIGWPNGGIGLPPSVLTATQSSQQAGSSPFYTSVPSSGQGTDPGGYGLPFGQGDGAVPLLPIFGLSLGQVVALGVGLVILVYLVNMGG